MAVRAVLSGVLAALLLPAVAVGQDPSTPDAVVVVEDVDFGPARLGENLLRARVRSVADTVVLVVMDLRAVPGMWMTPNIQRQFPAELEAGETRVLEGAFLLTMLTPESTLRVAVGPGRHMEEFGIHVVARPDFHKTYEVGRNNPHALNPHELFTMVRRGPLELWAWKGSLAESRLDEIAERRLEGLEAMAELLGVKAPDSIRLVFYADEATKLEQTGHRGLGWARGSTLVEVYNDSVRMDPYHELAHVVAAAAGSPPPLLDEGFAVYASERLGADALEFMGLPGRSGHGVVCGLRGTSHFIPLAELLALDNIGSNADRSAREYAEAGSFVKFLVESRGLERFREAYGGLSEELAVEARPGMLSGFYGASLAGLEAEWLEAVESGCSGS